HDPRAATEVRIACIIDGMKITIAGAILLTTWLGGCSIRESAKVAPEEFFPITPWELPAEKQKQLGDPVQGVTSLRDCGFTTAAFVTPDQLPLCEKAGMRALVALPGEMIKWRE